MQAFERGFCVFGATSGLVVLGNAWRRQLLQHEEAVFLSQNDDR